MKTCKRCGELKPLESFYKDKKKADGHFGSCKACMNSLNKAWLKANPEKARAALRMRRLAHPEKHRAADRKWRLANPEKVRAAYRAWSKANPEKARSKWEKAHPEKARAAERKRRLAHPEKFRARERKWRNENRGVRNAKTVRYQAAKFRAVPKWSERELIKIVYEKASAMGFDVDHVVSLQSKVVCGLHVWNNLQLLSSAENVKKSNLTWPDMWEGRMAA